MNTIAEIGSRAEITKIRTPPCDVGRILRPDNPKVKREASFGPRAQQDGPELQGRRGPGLRNLCCPQPQFRMKEGEFRAEAHHLGLEQDLPADACVDIFFLADLKRILERYGNRGYRAVQLEAGAIGGRIYLAAYAQHLGATGLTFFDDDVINFFSPHATDKSAIFLLAIGKPRKRKPQ